MSEFLLIMSNNSILLTYICKNIMQKHQKSEKLSQSSLRKYDDEMEYNIRMDLGTEKERN